ncbi:MAG: hypothetical protein AAF602_07065 [Myxococcota bacterium]
MILLLALGIGSATEPVPPPKARIPTDEERLHELVADPTSALLADSGTTRGFRIITLSNAAEASLRHARSGAWSFDDARQAITRLAATAIDRRISPFADPAGPYGQHNLYVTHWLIVLTALAELDPMHAEAQRGPTLADHLAAASLSHPSGIARSFDRSPARWPADQAATLYALSHADRVWGGARLAKPLARYVSVVPARDSAVAGLPVSEWTGAREFHDEPRGSALTWSVRYLADVDPELARRWWTAGKLTFESVGLGLVGFREWPAGHEHPADIDSGPILLGMSAAATAFALGASRAMDDCPTYTALAHTQHAVKEMVADPEVAATFGGVASMRAVQQTALATAIAANQGTIPTKCPDPASTGVGQPPG